MTTSYFIVADIGGTNARFAFVKEGERELQQIECFPCDEFPLFIDAVRAYIEHSHVPSASGICLAVAGPVEQDWIDLPNNHWTFSRAELERALGIPVRLINDFSAQVLAVSGLNQEEISWIGDPRPGTNNQGVVAVLGPGTGLGVSAMLPSGEIVPSEGGHIGFSPNDRHQCDLLGQLWQRYDRVSVERLLSGMGLSNLYWANARLVGQDRELPAEGVTAGARAGDALCLKTIQDFSSILGSVAGDVALVMGAYKGVYLSGGILPKMLDVLDTISLRASFDNKGRFRQLCSEIPVGIVLASYPGLDGCVQALPKNH